VVPTRLRTVDREPTRPNLSASREPVSSEFVGNTSILGRAKYFDNSLLVQRDERLGEIFLCVNRVPEGVDTVDEIEAVDGLTARVTPGLFDVVEGVLSLLQSRHALPSCGGATSISWSSISADRSWRRSSWRSRGTAPHASRGRDLGAP